MSFEIQVRWLTALASDGGSTIASRGCSERDGGSGRGTVLGGVGFESFGGYNSVNVCGRSNEEVKEGVEEGRGRREYCQCDARWLGNDARYSPVKMFWKAFSTLLASNADVSMKLSPFS